MLRPAALILTLLARQAEPAPPTTAAPAKAPPTAAAPAKAPPTTAAPTTAAPDRPAPAAPRPAGKAKPTAGTSGGGKAREAVEKLLRASERPPAPGDVMAIGPGAEDALVAVAGDGKAEASLRGRATAALAHAVSPRARTFLLEVVTRAADGDATERLVLRRAAVALGWQGGPAAPPPLGLLLAHADPEVRTDAAVGLGLTRLAPAATLLRNHLMVEKDERVRAHVARQLRTIEATLDPSGTDRTAAAAEPETAAPANEVPSDLPRTGTRRRSPAPAPPTRMQPNRSRF